MGIDVGALDEVILIQSPMSISAALQRIGRAGHRVGEVSKGLFFPTHGRDLLEAAAIGRCVLDREIESGHTIQSPLDVLAQVIAAMTGVEIWDIDALYHFLQTSYPYHELSRVEYDLVLKMLSGHYAGSRNRALQPLVSIDRIDNTIRAKEKTLRLVYQSGGTIPDRGYFILRRRDTGTKVGELDEEFVWEHKPGDVFTFGAQNWKIHQITHNDVIAALSDGTTEGAPFWIAEEINRDFHLAEKISLFLETADSNLQDSGFEKTLIHDYCMEETAARSLILFLRKQKKASGTGLPHRHNLLVEYTQFPGGDKNCSQVILHTLWGGKVNYPFALALSALWENTNRSELKILPHNDAIAIIPPYDFPVKEFLLSLRAEDIESLLRQKLERSGFFGARFRENAARALLLPRDSFDRRTPLWLNRMRSKKTSGHNYSI